MSILHLFLMFIRIGFFTIGGGLASLPLLKTAVVDGGLLRGNEFIDMIAVSQSTPGPIGINMATYTGFKLASAQGSLAATTGIVLPSLVIIILIAAFMKNYASKRIVKNVLWGIRPAAIGLIASASWYVIIKSLLNDTPAFSINIPALILFAVLFAAYRIKPLPAPVYILTGAVIGMVVF